MSAVMDHIATSGEEHTRASGVEGFATLWSDMPQDVLESVHLSAGKPASVARLTMSDPTAKVEIRINPRACRADAQRPAALVAGAQPRPAHPQAMAMPAEEEDQNP